MFPTSGYFRAIGCPFYVNGLCERPYCHFRHTKQDNEKAKDDVPSYSTAGVRCTSPVDVSGGTKLYSHQPSIPVDSYYTSKEPPVTFSSTPKSSTELLLAGLGESFAIPSFTDTSARYPLPSALEEQEQYLTASKKKEKVLSDLMPSSCEKYPLSESEEGPLPTYCPTPKTPSLPAISSNSGSSVPDYQPTPKRVLKRRNVDPCRAADMEYDPASNFSCGGLSKDHSVKNESDEYKPTEKKAKMLVHKSRLSCDSLVGLSPNRQMLTGFDDEDDGEGTPDGEFSEDEPDPEPVLEKMEDSEDDSENFQNIGDEDISSDDEFIEVPTQLQHSDSKKAKSTVTKSDITEHRKDLKDLENVKHKTSNKRDKTHGHVAREKNIAHNVKSATSEMVTTESTKKSHSSGSVKSKSTEKSRTLSNKHHKTSSTSSTHKKSISSLSSSGGHPPKQSVSIKESVNSKHTSKERHNKHKVAELGRSKSNGSNKLSSDRQSCSASGSQVVNKTSKASSSKSHSLNSKHTSAKSHVPETHSKNTSARQSVHFKKSSLSHDSKHGLDGRSSVVTLTRSDSFNESGGFLGSVRTELAPKENNSVKSRSENVSRVTGDGVVRRKSSSDHRNASHKRKLSSDKFDVTDKNKRNNSTDKLSIEKRRSSADKASAADKRKVPTDKLKNGKPDSSTPQSGSAKKIVSRMNSDLFGDDSDDGNVGADVKLSGEPSTSLHADADNEFDYTNFIHDSDFEDEDTFDECLRIFKENSAHLGSAVQQGGKLIKDAKPKPDVAQEANLGKKRVAHSAADQVKKPDLLKKARARQQLSPAQVMHNRIMEMQRRALERAAKQAVQEQEVSSTSGSASNPASSSGAALKSQGQAELSRGGEKKRVAHTLKPPVPSPSSSAGSSVTMVKKGDRMVTIASTASKSEKRVAHTPNLSNLKRPVIPASFGSKVPSNIRQRYLNLIIDECLKFCNSEEAAYKKGLEEESGVYERASNKNIYLRVAVNTITRLRSEAKDSSGLSSSSSLGERRPSLTQSHQATLGGSRAAKTSFTLHRSSSTGKKTEVALTGPELYQKMLKYCLTEEQLVDNGFPRPSPDTPGEAVCHGTRYQDTDTLLKGNERTCARCGKRFIVHADGTYVNQEECVYHWTRAYPRKKSGFIQHIYNCCNSDTSSQGCQIASNHVHDKNKQEKLTGFQRTMPRSPPPDGNYGVFALDCEMVYTLAGLELARVTIVDTEGKSVFESLVKPFSSIVDYNSRFSGLTAADLKDVTTSLMDIQAVLLSMFSDKTVLIGHSLESDLFALKLIHSTVVDTSVVFPHRLGPPYKRALKNLMLETFQKIIQSDDGGHDSKEDAVSCLDLMKWRIKEDSRRELRYS